MNKRKKKNFNISALSHIFICLLSSSSVTFFSIDFHKTCTTIQCICTQRLRFSNSTRSILLSVLLLRFLPFSLCYLLKVECQFKEVKRKIQESISKHTYSHSVSLSLSLSLSHSLFLYSFLRFVFDLHKLGILFHNYQLLGRVLEYTENPYK